MDEKQLAILVEAIRKNTVATLAAGILASRTTFADRSDVNQAWALATDMVGK